MNTFFSTIQAWLITNTSWIYIGSVGIVLFICFWLITSRYGDIKLGPDHSEPEYDNLSWFAMLFSAGMGIGLLFFGVAEPVMHFTSPPIGDGSTIESAREAMKITYFHWGLHAWALYSILAITLSYYSFRKNLPLLPRSAFYPFIGDRIYGPIGHTIDSFCIIGTMFGVATTLGFGVTQVNAGLSYLFGLPQNATVQIILIACITVLATISVVLGLDGGIKKLSNLNVGLACLLLLSILILGNTVDILQSYVQNTGAYLSDIVYKTFNLYAYDRKDKWIGGWTVLYWGWWISWSPFVGMFIARISRGRTIREFLVGVLFIPPAFIFLWMTTFGNSAINLILKEGKTELATVISENVPLALFKFFEYFPFSTVLTGLGLVLVITFFVSSSDSGSLVIDTLASGGAHEPPVWQRIFWAGTEGLVAAILLATGGLEALQTMTIASAFPIIIMIFVGTAGLIKSLKDDYLYQSSVQNHNTSIQYATAGASWKERLDSIINHPSSQEANLFLTKTVNDAFSEVKDEIVKKGLEASVTLTEDKKVSLLIKNESVDDFVYEVRLREYDLPDYATQETKTYFRAEVFISSGGQDYDIFGYTKEQIIADIVTQYEKLFHYLHLSTSDSNIV